jgi:hypothetical protein
VNPLIETEEPYVMEEYGERGTNRIVPYDDTFMMGCTRPSYGIYKKSLEYFCPVWLEDVRNDDILSFTFCARSRDTNGYLFDISKKVLNLSINGVNEFHDKFVRYFRQYVQEIKLDDRIIYIDFDNMKSKLTGVNVKTGLLSDVDISSLVRDITNQERLFMETDSLITEQLTNHHMICKQLFNFNFAFNIEDIFSPSIARDMKGKSVHIDVRVSLNRNDSSDIMEFEIKDFYTNYNYMPSTFIRDTSDYTPPKILKQDHQTPNVFNGIDFNGLFDYLNINLVNKNKINQSVCHWSLADYNDYIFNVYPEMGGYCTEYYDSENEYGLYKVNKNNQNAPDIWTKEYSKANNNTGWVNMEFIDSQQEFIEIDYSPENWISKSSKVDEWCNMLQYSSEKADILRKNKLEHILVVGLRARSGDVSSQSDRNAIWTNIVRDIKLRKDTDNKKYFIVSDGEIASRLIFVYYQQLHFLIIFTIIAPVKNQEQPHLNKLTFASFKEFVNNFPDSFEFKEALGKWMDSVVVPKTITFTNCLGYMRAPGPILDTKEVNHWYHRNKSQVFRMDGYIKPTFTSPANNQLFYKVVFKDAGEYNGSVFPPMVKSNYPPHYPSILYYPWHCANLTMDEKDPLNRTVELCIPEDLLPYEYKWYTSSQMYNIDEEINLGTVGASWSFSPTSGTGPSGENGDSGIGTITGIEPDVVIDNIEDVVIERLQAMYKVSKEEAQYIFSLYNLETTWDYSSKFTTNNITYTIKLVLK